MSYFIKNGLLPVRSSSLLFKRFRGKINIQKPREPHYKRALFNAVTAPIIIKPKITELCYNGSIQPKLVEKSIEVTPYERIIAREFVNWLNHSKFVGIFHMNSISSEDMFKARVAYHKYNIKLKIYGKSIIKQGITGTKYEAILPLTESRNCFLFSPEPRVNEVLKISKKIPQLILMAGIAEDRLLSKDQLIELARLPDLSVARAQIVAVLNSVGGSIVQNLQSHQCNLISLLNTHAESQTNQTHSNADKTEIENNKLDC